MFRVKKNDMVKVLAGKDKGKTGKVLKVFPARDRAIVQGVNFVKRHVKRKRQDEQGGIIQQEASIHVSDLNIICKRCNRSTRGGVDVLSDGSKVRYCRKCREVL
ncbi:MAG: 50S ribosomal protein L24 [Candidatus Omnitrophica bacterium]|nr:50S ribosomal protein L24 [Candidatus Omnitrophota bacterium]